MTDRNFAMARTIGACLQGLGLGFLLAIAVIGFVAASSEATVFRYQGF